MKVIEVFLALAVFGVGCFCWTQHRQADALERIADVLESIEWEEVER